MNVYLEKLAKLYTYRCPITGKLYQTTKKKPMEKEAKRTLLNDRPNIRN